MYLQMKCNNYIKKKLVYLGFAFQHHKGTHAGYQHIKNYLPYDYIIDCQKWFDDNSKGYKNLIDHIIRKICFMFLGSERFPFYLIKCIWLSFFHKNLIIHFVHTENTFFSLVHLIPRRTKVVCTLHQPFSWYNQRWIKRLHRANKIILLSDKEILLFREALNNEHVYYIPHGIDTDYYQPGEYKKNGKISILTVGNWLRDYQLAGEVYKSLLAYNKNVEINIVASSVSKADFIADNRIHVWNGISDEQLRQLYRQSDCLFLPLKRFTANNALLEAASCGCNIVIASDYNDNSYIPSQYLHICPLKEQACVDNIRKIVKNREPNLALRQFIIDYYDWHLIGQETYKLLEEK